MAAKRNHVSSKHRVNLDEVAEPLFELTWKGKTRTCNPLDLALGLEGLSLDLGKLQAGQGLDTIRMAFGLPTWEQAGRDSNKTLTAMQCIALVQALSEFLDGLDTLKNLLGADAELIRYGVCPTVCRKLSPWYRDRLRLELERIRCRERFQSIADVAAAFDGSNESRNYKVELAKAAFSNDKRSLAVALEALTRSR